MPGETMTQAPTKTPFQDWMAGVVPPPSPAAIMQLGTGLLGFEGAAERGGARPVHRAGRGGPAGRGGARASASACIRAARATSSMRWSRCGMLVARAAGATPIRRTPTLFLDRGQAALRRRHAGDGQRPALPASGAAHRGAAHRQPQNEAKTAAATSSTRSTPTRPARGSSSAAMTGLSRRDATAMAGKFPWADYADVRRHRLRRRAACRSQIALAHPHLTGGGFDLPPVGPIFEDYVAARSGWPTGCVSPPATSSPTRCRRPTCWSWATSCTTGTCDEKACCSPRPTTALPDGRRADRLRGDHRRRAAGERLRPADEPEHADRDAGRLRLHRRRLPRLDAGGRLPRDRRRAPARARFDGRSASSRRLAEKQWTFRRLDWILKFESKRHRTGSRTPCWRARI